MSFDSGIYIRTIAHPSDGPLPVRVNHLDVGPLISCKGLVETNPLEVDQLRS